MNVCMYVLYIHTYRQVNQESRSERLVTLLQRSFKAVVRCMYVYMYVCATYCDTVC